MEWFIAVLLVAILIGVIRGNIVISINNQEIRKIMATLDETLAAVTEEKGQIASLSTLVAGIKKQLDDVLAGQLPAEVQAKVDAIFAGVQENKQAVADAINANDNDPNT